MDNEYDLWVDYEQVLIIAIQEREIALGDYNENPSVDNLNILTATTMVVNSLITSGEN